jgi:hypothetical protein
MNITGIPVHYIDENEHEKSLICRVIYSPWLMDGKGTITHRISFTFEKQRLIFSACDLEVTMHALFVKCKVDIQTLVVFAFQKQQNV